MQNPNRDLWPKDIATTPDLLTPVSILREQASLLGQKTQNLVEAEVVSSSSGNGFTHSFLLVAPALGHYRYLLFRIHHPIDFYPIAIEGDPVSEPLKATATVDSQEDFIKRLEEIFSSERTKKVIQSMIAQSVK